MEKEAQCHNTIYHHYIPHIVVEDTIPHYSWQSVYSDNAPMNWNTLMLKKKEKEKKEIMSVYNYAWWKMQLVNVEPSLSVYQVSTCFVFTDKSYG